MDETSSNLHISPETRWIFNAVDSNWLRLNWLDGYQPNLAVVVLLLVAVAVYSAWYYLLVVNKPRVVGGGTSLREHVLTHCPILSQYYYPTFWACGCHFTTIGRAKLQKCPGVMYDRYGFMNKCPRFCFLPPHTHPPHHNHHTNHYCHHTNHYYHHTNHSLHVDGI